MFGASATLLIAFRSLVARIDRSSALVTDGDTTTHLLLVREHKRRPRQKIDFSETFVLEKTDYPTGFHRVISLLPLHESSILNWGRYLPTLSDLILLLVIWIVTVNFGGDYFSWLLAFPFLRALWGNAGRASHFGERAIGVLLGNLYLVSITLAYLTGSVPILLASFAFLILAFSASKFAIQAITLFSILLSLLTISGFFVISLIVFFLLSILFTKGYTWNVVLGLVRHSELLMVLRRSGRIETQPFYKQLVRLRSVRDIIRVSYSNSVLRIFTDNPVNLVVVVATLKFSPDSIFVKWSLIGILLCLLFSFQGLQFMGEPERYLEFSLPATFVVASFVDPTENTLLTVAVVTLLLLISLVGISRRVQGRQGDTKRAHDLEGLVKVLGSLNGCTMLTNPGRLSVFIASRFSKFRFMWVFTHTRDRQITGLLLSLWDHYPTLSSKAIELAHAYGVTLVVVEKMFAPLDSRFMKALVEARAILIFENASFGVYSLPPD